MTAETDQHTIEKDYTLASGSVVDNRYRIIGLLGEGGMGIVYKAQHLYTERIVAVKMMLEQSSANSPEHRRFQREAKAASALHHQNIVSIHDFGFFNGRAFISMDFVEGVSFDQMLQRGPLSLDRFRNLFAQICDALEHAHERGMIHRDIKPSNLMISTDDDGCESAIILDFGLVKLSADIANSRITATNMIVGSPIYMSPEQCKALELDHRSDIYSLGCVMYEALTGSPPLPAENAFDFMHKHINEMPKSFREVAPWVYVPPALERTIMSALAKHPDERPQSMREFLQNIERAFDGSPDVFVKPLAPQSSQSISRKTRSKIEHRKAQTRMLRGASVALATIALVSFGIWLGEKIHPLDAHSPGWHETDESDVNAHADSLNDSKSAVLEEALSPIDTLSGRHEPSANRLTQSGPSDSAVLNFAHPLSKLFRDENAKPLIADSHLAQLKMPLQSGIRSSNHNTAAVNALDKSLAADLNKSNSRALANNGSLAASFAPFNNSIGEIHSDHSLAQSPLFEDSLLNPAPSLDQTEGEANVAFNNSKWTEARQKFEQVRSRTSSSEKETIAAAKLLCSAFAQGDLKAASEYLVDVKRLILFNPHSLENDPSLIARIYKIYKQLVGSEDSSFSERILRLAVDAFSRQSMQPTNASIHMKMELRRVLLDQGKTGEADTLLQECLREAAQISDQNLLNTINAMIAQGGQSQGNGGFGGGGGLPAAGGISNGNNSIGNGSTNGSGNGSNGGGGNGSSSGSVNGSNSGSGNGSNNGGVTGNANSPGASGTGYSGNQAPNALGSSLNGTAEARLPGSTGATFAGANVQGAAAGAMGVPGVAAGGGAGVAAGGVGGFGGRGR